MKCSEIDLLAYLEGHSSEAIRKHIEACENCTADAANLSYFLDVVLPAYGEGKKLEKEVDAYMLTMDVAAMKPLPPAFAKKVSAMRENALISRIKKVVGKNMEAAKEIIDRTFSPDMQAMPASPKDLPKKQKPKRKKKAAK